MVVSPEIRRPNVYHLQSNRLVEKYCNKDWVEVDVRRMTVRRDSDSDLRNWHFLQQRTEGYVVVVWKGEDHQMNWEKGTVDMDLESWMVPCSLVDC